MINKSKDKIFQKYYRLNPNEFLDLLENWRNTCKRQEKLLKESLTHLTIFWNLSGSKDKKILYSSEYAYEIGKFLKNAKELTQKIEKEISKDMAC